MKIDLYVFIKNDLAESSRNKNNRAKKLGRSKIEMQHLGSAVAILTQGNGPVGIIATNLDPGSRGTE